MSTQPLEQYLQILGSTIRRYRKAIRRTQEYIAEQADISHRYFQEIEQGRGQPSLKTVMRIAKALEITVMQLLEPVWEEYSKLQTD